MTFEQVTQVDEFDAIWACASLLHVPRANMPGVLGKLAGALKVGGLWYASFKWGEGERVVDDRQFTDFTAETFAVLLQHVPQISIVKWWKNADLRGRNSEWLNMLLTRTV
jgi:hypothetical protein